MLYRGCEQLVILVGIMELEWELGLLRVLYRGYEQLVIIVGIGNFNRIYDYSLLGILRILYRVYDQLVILVGFRHLNGNLDSKSVI